MNYFKIIHDYECNRKKCTDTTPHSKWNRPIYNFGNVMHEPDGCDGCSGKYPQNKNAQLIDDEIKTIEKFFTSNEVILNLLTEQTNQSQAVSNTELTYVGSYRTNALPPIPPVAPKTKPLRLTWAWFRGVQKKIKIREARIQHYPKLINLEVGGLVQIWHWWDRQLAAAAALKGKSYQLRGCNYAPFEPNCRVSPTDKEIKELADRILWWLK